MRRLWFSIVTASFMTLLAAAEPKGPGTAALQSALVISGTQAERDANATSEAAVERFPAISVDQAGEYQISTDGTHYLLFRFQSSGAPAVRLHVRSMRLPQGARLFVYGMRNGAVTEVAGPYEGSGPGIDDDFWTDAVSGSEAVVEFQAGAEVPGDLPFEITELQWADRASVTANAPAPETRTSLYRGMALTHNVENGLAVFEHDIILGPADEMLALSAKDKPAGRQAVAITGARYRWPSGVVPYVINAAVTNPTRLINAINHWNTTMAGHVKLIARTTETAYVEFIRSSNAGTCSSSVGMLGYRQLVQVGDACGTGNLIHEIGHVFGLWHEQSREDRNTFVKVLMENVLSGTTHNFAQNISNGDDIAAYDYASIMHYGATAFSSNGKPTIETIPAGIPIGQRSALSTGDIAAIKLLYPAQTVAPTPAPSQVSTIGVTLTTNPTGLPVTADGVTYTSPATLQWAPGSMHVISASAPVSAQSKHLFQRWSDGGTQSHAVTASAGTTLYKADFAVQHAVQASASTNGTLSMTPLSADGFYAANTSLSLAARPSAGYCFAGWTGLIAGTPASTSVMVTKPYSIQASFAPGSITLSSTSLSVPASGATISVGINASSGCYWTASSPLSWVTVPPVSGKGPAVISVQIAPNPVKSMRMAVVAVGSSSVLVMQAAAK